jgi:hypothetical protein
MTLKGLKRERETPSVPTTVSEMVPMKETPKEPVKK